MPVFKSRLNLKSDTPFCIIHLSDTHLTRADMRDGERKVKLANDRKNMFPEAEKVLSEALSLSEELGVPVIHTGDLIDFVSVANLEKVKKITDRYDIFMAAGNHEFSLYVGEAKEDAAYRNQSLSEVQSAFKNNIRMSSRIINGVNFVALDNGYYLFEEEQADFLKNEVKKQLPVVLLLHTPLFEKKLYDFSMTRTPCAYLAGVPDELMKCYPADRYEQQKADSTTLDLIDYIAGEEMIKAVIAGHMHFTYDGLFADRIPQIITGCTDIRITEIQ